MKKSFLEHYRLPCHDLCHPTAIVETDRIGENVEVGAFSYITDRVVIEDNVKIGPHVILGTPAQVSDGKDHGRDLVIKSGTVIREMASVNTPMGDKDSVIGENCFLMANAHISHDMTIGDSTILGIGLVIAGYLECGKHTYFGINSSVHQYAKIGDYSLIGAGSFFKGKSPRGLIWVGSPAKPIKINMVGLTRYAGEQERNEIIAEAQDFLNIYGLGK